MAAGFFETLPPSPANAPGTFPALFWGLYTDLDGTQWAPRAELEEHQLGLVRKLLEHAIAEVPYYAERLAAAGIVPAKIESWDDFRKVPILSRRECQEEYARLEARRLPEGQTAGGELMTSGTTGVPIRVRQTNLVQTFWFALLLRDMEWCGIDPKGSIAVMRSSIPGDAPRARATWGRPLSDVVRTGPAHTMNVKAAPERHLQWLRECDPHYVLSYPTHLDYLAFHAADEGASFSKLRLVQSFAETLEPDVATRIARGFRAPVKNLYTSVEAGYIASPCPVSGLLHVHSESMLVEVLDDRDRLCAPGRTGRIVLTTLRNFRSPFIRYDIGDEATVGPAACPCGRGLPTLASVSGKKRPLLKLVGGGWQNSSALVTALRNAGGFLQFQIVQPSAERLQLRIVPAQGWSDEHRRRLVDATHRCLGVAVDVRVELLERLERTPGGKLQSVVCEVPS
jgi:phenylacetate-CoA ligase